MGSLCFVRLGRRALCAWRLLAVLVSGALAACGAEPAPNGGDYTDTGLGEGGEPAVPEEEIDQFIDLDDGQSPCLSVDTSERSLAKQAIDHASPWTKVLYSWTVSAQEDALRAEEKLLTVGEMPVLGKGIAMDLLTVQASNVPDSLENLVNSQFAKFRYAWPNPWATRLGPGGEDYGDRLIKMVLKDEAWFGVLTGKGNISAVFDLMGTSIPLETAKLTPERIAVLYFVRDSSSGGPFCGTFSGGSGGYREFIVGNEAMLEEWSLGTKEINERVESDVEDLLDYVEAIRSCPPRPSNGDFNADVVCGWGWRKDVYQEALALPGDAYRPTPENIFSLIQILEEGLTEPLPLVVKVP